ncbi:MAG: RNA-binding protein [Caulobacteraceae bacterium]|nr:RNA-binding protein [Caulobacteraceae bacterium]
MTAVSPPATHAEASRQRRDIVSGEVMNEDRLIRFVAGPEGEVVPDLGRKLPGRGVWVAASREAVTTAAKKNLFSRSAKAKLTAPTDLADQVESRLRNRLLSGLGLARKAGALTSGFEAVREALASGRVRYLIEACDGASDGRRKVLALVRKSPQPVTMIGVFSQSELGLALGLENVVHTALLAGRSTERWAVDIDRLAGFRPLFPESWLSPGP